MSEEIKKPGRGCLFYGALIGGILLTVILIASFFGYRYASGLAEQLTDPHPVPLPRVELSEIAMSLLEERIANFREAVQQDQPTEPLALTATEVNALIATNASLRALKDRMFLTIDNDQLHAQLSFPAEELGIELLKGRFVNATGTFSVVVHNGELRIHAENLTTKGKPLPETVMRQLRGRNLAQGLNNDPSVRRGLARIEAVEVKDGKLVVVPKK